MQFKNIRSVGLSISLEKLHYLNLLLISKNILYLGRYVLHLYLVYLHIKIVIIITYHNMRSTFSGKT